jgi:hypothetical protein
MFPQLILLTILLTLLVGGMVSLLKISSGFSWKEGILAAIGEENTGSIISIFRAGLAMAIFLQSITLLAMILRGGA